MHHISCVVAGALLGGLMAYTFVNVLGAISMTLLMNTVAFIGAATGAALGSALCTPEPKPKDPDHQEPQT